MKNYKIYWGETHDNIFPGRKPSVSVEENFAIAASHMDFYAAAYYTAARGAIAEGGEHWKDPTTLDEEWSQVERLTARWNKPGEFVTFPGYEWQGDGSGGDHNIYAPREGLPVFRVDSLEALYDSLREWRRSGRDAIAIPHHTAYRPGRRGRDWTLVDEELTPFTEVYSKHGSSESDEELIGLRANSHMGPLQSGGTYQEALDRGYHLGAICSSDLVGEMPGHYGTGLTACLAEELTRESLWEAFRARRVYGVTGDRIAIDFRVNDAVMGSIVELKGDRHITVCVTGSDAIDRIELLRGRRVIHTHCHQGTWNMPEAGKNTRFKIRIEAGWGPRPHELDMDDRRWQGELSVEGGRLLDWEPCWVWGLQERPALSSDSARFSFVSSTRTLTERSQNALIFTFEADPGGQLRLRLNGQEETGPVLGFARGSRIIWYKEDCVRLLRERAGLEPYSAEREDLYWHLAFKAKIHRAVPEAGYSASLNFVDQEPLDGEVPYRVRVEQRNGQRAWSSPIWVKLHG